MAELTQLDCAGEEVVLREAIAGDDLTPTASTSNSGSSPRTRGSSSTCENAVTA
jgi:hypothetical protein